MSKDSFKNLFSTFLLIASVIAFSFSIFSIMKLDGFEERLNALELSTSEKIDKLSKGLNEEIGAIKRLISGGGVIEKYLVARNFLENSENDLRLILTELQENPERPYFRIFVAGSSEVWIGFKNNAKDKKYVYQKNFKPGLSEEKFFYLKAPLLETGYTVTLTKDTYIRTAMPDSVYLLFFGFNSAKIVKMPDIEVNNISRDFNLYVPGK
ncbi:hypothetical protein [Kosmotoga pacifica]|nr:hypothetical protein [Kosmotoga pacifica]